MSSEISVVYMHWDRILECVLIYTNLEPEIAHSQTRKYWGREWIYTETYRRVESRIGLGWSVCSRE